MRAVAGLFDTAVDWDGASKTVYLGSKGTSFMPVTATMVDAEQQSHFSQDPTELVIEGIAHNSGLVTPDLNSASETWSGADISLGGKYTTFSCWVYYNAGNGKNCNFSFVDKDTKAAKKTVYMTPGAPAQYVEFSVSGVDILRIRPEYLNATFLEGSFIIADMAVK